ncbi:30S ribosomal protein S15 [Candidatus Uzinura diaspidicola str. ASNER]|uniref:Small ribosomal subunit protein uS15 n=1 Tax=Candidatus Uzinura diaspidicola str. ASNER TaxID=1133592 RepID=L7VK73_9FLAO|nr:30S ribosomal protein S15 [Candidatus Uzinura diaspidicola str. ASNER]
MHYFMSKKLVKSPYDTGSSEVQINIFTGRIQHITEHLKRHKKDLNSQKSLLTLVGKRRKLLKYIKNSNIEIYRNIIIKLEIRK